jgi:bla regulator protein BlaR1
LRSTALERKLCGMKASRAMCSALFGVMLSALFPSGARAQTPFTPTPEPKFDVASIKPNKSPSEGIGGNGLGAGRWDRTNAPLSLLIAEAFGIRGEQLVGLPGWTNGQRFDVNARMDATDPATGNRPQARVMAQALLRERFSLTSHRETRDIPTYNVVLARETRALGPDLHQTDHSCRAMTAAERVEAMRRVPSGATFCGWYIRSSEGRSAGDGQPLDMLLSQFPFSLGRPVINKTGLTSPMTWMLKWRVEGVESDAPDLFVAFQEQLGLKLVSSHGPQEFLVIDSVSRPTPD